MLCLMLCLPCVCVLDGSRGLLRRLVHDLTLNKIAAYSTYRLLHLLGVP
jgi:hypothetical protein